MTKPLIFIYMSSIEAVETSQFDTDTDIIDSPG